MKIKLFKNKYGYERAQCPFCEVSAYTKNKIHPFRLKYLQRHIINQAKDEALQFCLNGTKNTPHLDFTKQHTKVGALKIITSKYQFDDSLTS